MGARKLSSALSAANAIANHMHDWVIGTPGAEYQSTLGLHGRALGWQLRNPTGCDLQLPCSLQGWKLYDRPWVAHLRLCAGEDADHPERTSGGEGYSGSVLP